MFNIRIMAMWSIGKNNNTDTKQDSNTPNVDQISIDCTFGTLENKIDYSSIINTIIDGVSKLLGLQNTPQTPEYTTTDKE